MHSNYPHPKDRLIILRVNGTPSASDRETVRDLLESRIQAHGQILLFLELDCGGRALSAWGKLLFGGRSAKEIERLAVLRDSAAIADDDLGAILPSTTVGHFTPDQRKEALIWVQTGVKA